MTAFLGQVTEDDIAAWLDELEAAGLIQRYEVDGRPYLHLCTWDKHQQRRAKTPKYPLPPSLAGGRADTQRDDSNCNHVQSDAGIRTQTSADAPVFENENEYENEIVVGVGNARVCAREGAATSADDDSQVEHIDDILTRVKSPELDRYFQTHFGTNAWNLSQLKLYVERGVDERAVIYALQLQQERDQNSRGIRLARSILDDWLSRGILTREAAERYERAFRERRRTAAGARADPPPDPEEHLTVDELQRRRRERGEYVDGPDAETVRELARAIGRTPT